LGEDHDLVAQALIDSAWNRFDLQEITEGTKRAEDAVRIYEHNSPEAEKFVHALSTLQRGYLLLRQYEKSAIIAARAIRTAGDLNTTEISEIASVIHALSDTTLKEGKSNEAEELAREALHIHQRLHGPFHEQTAWGFITLGYALEANKKFEEAESAYRKARDIFRQQFEIWHKGVRTADKDLIALWELTEQNTQESEDLRRELVAAARETKKLHPDDYHAFADFAITVHYYGTDAEYVAAIDAAREAVRLGPTNRYLVNNLGVLLYDNNQIDDAILVFEQQLSKAPDSALGHLNMAVALYTHGQQDEAEKHFRRALQLSPNIPERKLVPWILRLDSAELRDAIDIDRPPEKIEDESRNDVGSM
jgi:tetratricopeptide (TPR) repeat protein